MPNFYMQYIDFDEMKKISSFRTFFFGFVFQYSAVSFYDHFMVEEIIKLHIFMKKISYLKKKINQNEWRFSWIYENYYYSFLMEFLK